MARTLLALRDANPGWKTDHLLAAQIFLPKSGYREPHQVRSSTSPSSIGCAPRRAWSRSPRRAPCRPNRWESISSSRSKCRAIRPTSGAGGSIRLVTPGIFKTLGIPLIQGRDLDVADGDPKVRRLVVNQAFARKAPAGFARRSSAGRSSSFLALPRPTKSSARSETFITTGCCKNRSRSSTCRLPAGHSALWASSCAPPGTLLAFAPAFRKQLWALDPALPVASTNPWRHGAGIPGTTARC